jgi:CheY-like chemotaxis protein
MKESVAILVIDDQADQVENRVKLLPKNLRERFVVCDPEEVTFSQIEEADLVLVDYRLDKWEPNARETIISRKVPNGIALVASLQQQAMKCSRPTAFAIHSEHLGELTAPFKPEPRVHLLARAYNLEWAFVKSSQGAPT